MLDRLINFPGLEFPKNLGNFGKWRKDSSSSVSPSLCIKSTDTQNFAHISKIYQEHSSGQKYTFTIYQTFQETQGLEIDF